MQYLPLATLLGAFIGAIIASYITRAYWIEKVQHTHDHWRAHMLELAELAQGRPSTLRACELCRYSHENADTGAPVLICKHRATRMARGPAPCKLARADQVKCGPDARLWEARSERPGAPALADGSAWRGEGPAPAWWYTPDGRKVRRGE